MENNISESGDLSIIKFKILNSILECNLCLSMVCEPISISCGHTFCRVCLVKSLRRHKKQCPSCREICHIVPESATENVMLKNIAITIDPLLYQSRLAEVSQEKETWTTLYPIFYYNSVLLPGSRLDLHLFEPRYIIMMKRVVDTTRSFAYVPNFTSYNASNGDIALIAELKHADFLPDGRCTLEAVVSKRKRIVDHYVEDGTHGLHFCRVDDFEDDMIKEADTIVVSELKEKAINLSNSFLDTNSTTRRATMEYKYGAMPIRSNNNTEALSLWLTAICPLSQVEKNRLLYSKDTKERIERCISSLESHNAQRTSNSTTHRTSNRRVSDRSIIDLMSGITGRMPAADREDVTIGSMMMGGLEEDAPTVQNMMEQLSAALLGRRPRSTEDNDNEDDEEEDNDNEEDGIPGVISDSDNDRTEEEHAFPTSTANRAATYDIDEWDENNDRDEDEEDDDEEMPELQSASDDDDDN